MRRLQRALLALTFAVVGVVGSVVLPAGSASAATGCWGGQSWLFSQFYAGCSGGSFAVAGAVQTGSATRPTCKVQGRMAVRPRSRTVPTGIARTGLGGFCITPNPAADDPPVQGTRGSLCASTTELSTNAQSAALRPSAAAALWAATLARI